MSNFKDRVDLAILISSIIVNSAGGTLSDNEEDEMFEYTFKYFKDLLSRYDQYTITQMRDSMNTVKGLL